MGVEGEPRKEELGRGQLYFLANPGTDLFTGYGLTTHVGRQDRLVGLLMVDRPLPVNPAWLAQLEALYGECPLAPMTASGELGLLTQMRIAPESVPLLQRPTHRLVPELKQFLRPLLDVPPAPVLKLHWDREQQTWQSEFWIGLPPVLQEVFDRNGEGCLAVERDREVVFVTHARDDNLASMQGAPMVWRWELAKMPTAPLIRFHATIFDNPTAPYELEHFLNVADPEQARYLSLLVRQADLTFDYYGSEYEYTYTQQVAHPSIMRERLNAIVRHAIDYYGDIPAIIRDFDLAKALFQRNTPL